MPNDHGPEICKMYMNGQECRHRMYCRFEHPPHVTVRSALFICMKKLLSSIELVSDRFATIDRRAHLRAGGAYRVPVLSG